LQEIDRGGVSDFFWDDAEVKLLQAAPALAINVWTR